MPHRMGSAAARRRVDEDSKRMVGEKIAMVMRLLVSNARKNEEEVGGRG